MIHPSLATVNHDDNFGLLSISRPFHCTKYTCSGANKCKFLWSGNSKYTFSFFFAFQNSRSRCQSDSLLAAAALQYSICESVEFPIIPMHAILPAKYCTYLPIHSLVPSSVSFKCFPYFGLFFTHFRAILLQPNLSFLYSHHSNP